ncbi:hypothetical protein CCUS01_03912 [Colletotrichum cuscutae]|uniref:Uncharacterized protein n=1 Tax=Colletotrichum cuscutae TaxID=1209917 RepID=A0AAI9Y4A3_9PEZI|nr:hypothetical protein CCUS01_03912 [Colletotrichum cuscutae]
MHGNIGNGNEVAESFALGHRLCSGGILFRDKNIISFVDRNSKSMMSRNKTNLAPSLFGFLTLFPPLILSFFSFFSFLLRVYEVKVTYSKFTDRTGLGKGIHASHSRKLSSKHNRITQFPLPTAHRSPPLLLKLELEPPYATTIALFHHPVPSPTHHLHNYLFLLPTGLRKTSVATDPLIAAFIPRSQVRDAHPRENPPLDTPPWALPAVRNAENKKRITGKEILGPKGGSRPGALRLGKVMTEKNRNPHGMNPARRQHHQSATTPSIRANSIPRRKLTRPFPLPASSNILSLHSFRVRNFCMGVNVAVDDTHSYSWKKQEKKMAKRGGIGTGHVTRLFPSQRQRGTGTYANMPCMDLIQPSSKHVCSVRDATYSIVSHTLSTPYFCGPQSTCRSPPAELHSHLHGFSQRAPWLLLLALRFPCEPKPRSNPDFTPVCMAGIRHLIRGLGIPPQPGKSKALHTESGDWKKGPVLEARTHHPAHDISPRHCIRLSKMALLEPMAATGALLDGYVPRVLDFRGGGGQLGRGDLAREFRQVEGEKRGREGERIEHTSLFRVARLSPRYLAYQRNGALYCLVVVTLIWEYGYHIHSIATLHKLRPKRERIRESQVFYVLDGRACYLKSPIRMRKFDMCFAAKLPDVL